MAGKLLCLGTNGSTNLALYDAASMVRSVNVMTATGTPSGTINEASFSPDGSLLAVPSTGWPYLTLFRTSDWTKVTLAGSIDAAQATTCAFSPDGTKLALASYNVLAVYEAPTWTRVTLASAASVGAIRGLAFSPDGTKLAVCGESSPHVIFYTVSDWSRTVIGGLSTSGIWTTDCCWSPDGTKLAVAHSDTSYGCFTVYNTSNWSKISLTGGTFSNTTDSCRFSPDGTKLAVGHGSSPYLTVYDVSGWSKLTIAGGSPSSGGQVVAFSPDGSKLAVGVWGSPNGNLTIYDVQTWAKTTTAYFPGGVPYSLCFSPTDLSRAVSGAVLDDTGSATSRAIALLDRGTSTKLATTSSDASGNFGPVYISQSSEVQVICLDDTAGTTYNDLIHRVTPA